MKEYFTQHFDIGNLVWIKPTCTAASLQGAHNPGTVELIKVNQFGRVSYQCRFDNERERRMVLYEDIDFSTTEQNTGAPIQQHRNKQKTKKDSMPVNTKDETAEQREA